MEDDEITLIVDTNDAYLDDMSVFYMHPKRLNTLRCVSSQEFSGAVIQFSPIDTLTSLNFSYILRTLKPNSICEVYVHQPISVMQDYDAKQIEANAKLAGFVGFEQSTADVEHPVTKAVDRTIKVSFTRPEKKGEESEDKKAVPAKDTKGNTKQTTNKTPAPSTGTAKKK